VALIEPVLREAGSPLILVGHSYGGAVALRAALDLPAGDVRALVLYEPTLFALVDAESPPPNEADGIRGAVAESAAALDRGDRHAAAQAFIDYWMEEGAFRRMPEARREPIAAAAVNVRRWAHALHREPTPLEAFRRLECRCCCWSAGGRRRPRAAWHAGSPRRCRGSRFRSFPSSATWDRSPIRSR
jgi:pimeloyl-ACP methyl ester carboxylesterase